MGLMLGNLIGNIWMPESASTIAPEVDGLFDFILWLSIFFLVLILVVMIVFVVKYRHREGQENKQEPTAGHSTALELTWTIIPTILVIIIYYFGFRGFLHLAVPPPNSYEITATGRMWNWQFTYPNGYTDGELHIPLNVPVRVVLNSEDVIHSLFIPVFRVKKDVVPGRYNKMWFQATKTGNFDVECANYCGTGHSQMLTRAYVQEPEDFKKWLADASDWTKNTSPIAEGAKLYKAKGCVQCHSVDGTRGTGPTWKDMFGSQVPLEGGKTVLADEDYVRESIEYPQAKIVSTFGPISAMSSFKGTSSNDIFALTAYMKSISKFYSGDLESLRIVPRNGKLPLPAGALQNGQLETQPTSNNPQPTTIPAKPESLVK